MEPASVIKAMIRIGALQRGQESGKNHAFLSASDR